MRYRRFGKTNLHLSVFSLGTMRYLASEETACQTVQQALSQGINHLETAAGYGCSEEYLGAALSAGLSVHRSRLQRTTRNRPTGGGGVRLRRGISRCGPLGWFVCPSIALPRHYENLPNGGCSSNGTLHRLIPQTPEFRLYRLSGNSRFEYLGTFGDGAIAHRLHGSCPPHPG